MSTPAIRAEEFLKTLNFDIEDDRDYFIEIAYHGVQKLLNVMPCVDHWDILDRINEIGVYMTNHTVCDAIEQAEKTGRHYSDIKTRDVISPQHITSQRYYWREHGLITQIEFTVEELRSIYSVLSATSNREDMKYLDDVLTQIKTKLK